MSHDATNWAIKQRGIKPALKVVLWHLCDCFNPENGCFPSQDYLAEHCEVPRSTLNVYLGELERLGLIVREQRRKKGSMQQERTRYFFPFEPEFDRKKAQFPCPETGHGGEEAVSENGAEPSPENGKSRVQNLDSNPVREPVKEPVIERESAREAHEDRLEPEDPKKVDAAFWEFIKDWPGFGPLGKEPARKLWHAMTVEERRLAVERYPGWRKMLKDARKDHVPTPQTYFRGKLWSNVPDPAEAPKPTSTLAGPFGKLWSAYRLAELLLPPTGIITPPTKFEQMQIDQGATSLAAVIAEKRRRSGWPTVNAMLDRARQAQGWICPLALDEAARSFQQMRTSSALFDAWRVDHLLRGWPFLDDGKLPEWVYFPPIEAEGDLVLRVTDAVERYREQISDYLSARSRGNDDAA
ncbi:helix-turn-helix domain-containing protein [Sinorhizobium sp. 8-89]|uniref:helix-turn-helix domain-containing protein n=1 Tax=Sinorhizobium sp. 7-81 TaxID=3049087 RepID=UPI0024C3C8B6|nr:helix-turn-helix domain-containing protein [Sinorhizobium sp. 7-81]MDK1386354.1 helix-turn-helix domain-containing protein [Sinorhizobium sp. 7-81]